jgi:murein DD-endopeptidase MepM/ murein hydrolase activator NlpD
MKKLLCAIIPALLIPSVIMPESLMKKQRMENTELIESQQSRNKADHQLVLEQMNSFLSSVNGRLMPGKGGKKPALSPPIELREIQSIETIDHGHSEKKTPPKILAYINADKVSMRAEGNDKAPVLGVLSFQERVELLARSDDTETIGGVTAPWILLRREDGGEGWVFGHYIQKSLPKKKEETGTEKPAAQEDFARLKLPAAGKKTSGFGYRVDPVTKRRGAFHSGIDIAAPRGTPVLASEAGVVAKAEFYRNGYGNLVVIEHGKGLCTYYGHLKIFHVKKGQIVKKGDLIGAVGTTGRVTGPHLHFEVRQGDTALDPDAFL